MYARMLANKSWINCKAQWQAFTWSFNILLKNPMAIAIPYSIPISIPSDQLRRCSVSAYTLTNCTSRIKYLHQLINQIKTLGVW
jgi:hypothetical protein